MTITATSLVTIPFEGGVLAYAVRDGAQFVPIKPICEALGIDPRRQRRKLSASPERWGGALVALPSGGGEQEMLCLPLARVFGWLMTIHPNRVKPETRNKLIAYQQRCDAVLYAHFVENSTGYLVRLETANRFLRGQLLAGRALWSRVAHLVELGYGRERIRRQLRMGLGEFDELWAAMAEAALVPVPAPAPEQPELALHG